MDYTAWLRARTSKAKTPLKKKNKENRVSLTSLLWWDEPLSAIKSPSNHSPSPKSLRFASRQQHCVSVYSQIFCCYSRATQDWAENGEERWAACICKGGKKKLGWWYPAYIFVVICVFQVKLQIRGHFHHQGLQREADEENKDILMGSLWSYQCNSWLYKLHIKAQLLILESFWQRRKSGFFCAISFDWGFILIRTGRVSWQCSHVSLVCSATFPLCVCVRVCGWACVRCLLTRG